MSNPRIESLRIKAKLLQKAKKKAGKLIKLKAAFEIIAKYSGFNSWRELKEKLAGKDTPSFPMKSAFWNTWYSTYEEARTHLETSGGFLLPYEKHFFICDVFYIESLGIPKEDPDLAKVGANWVEPADKVAWKNLLKKIREAAT